jgi:hypothetical protein
MAGKDLTITLTAKDGTSQVFKQVGTEAERMGLKVTSASDKSSESIKRIAGNAKLLGAAMGVGVGAAVKLASDLNESTDKARRTFGDNFAEIQRFAADAATSMGLSAREAEDAASAFGLMFQSAGESGQQLTDMSEATTQLAADLGSLYNVGSQEAQQALISGLTGETEPLRQFNIFLSETAVNAELAREGLQAVGGQFTDQQKVIARYNLIMQQGQTASGNFIETSDGLANSMKIAHAELSNAAADLGTSFLPATIQAAHGVSALAEAFSSLPHGAQTAIGDIIMGVGGVAALTIGAVKIRELTQDMRELAAAAKATQLGGAALDLAMGPAGLALGIGVAALALYEFTGRQNEAAISTSKLNDLITTNTDSVLANASAYERLGILSQVDTETTFFNTLLETGQQNLDTINDMQVAIQKLNQMGGGEFTINKSWDLLETGISQADAAWLDSAFGNGNGKIGIDELSAAMDYYTKSLTLNGDQTNKLQGDWSTLMGDVRDAGFDGVKLWTDITAILSNPNLTGDQMVAAFDNLVAHQGDYNIALQKSKETTDDLTDAQRYATTEWKASVPVIVAATEALEQNATQAQFVATAYSASLPVIATYHKTIGDIVKDMNDLFAPIGAASKGVHDFTSEMSSSAAVTEDYSAQIKDLADSFSQVDAAKNAYDLVVGFTDGMVSSIKTSKDWADALIAPVGTYSKLDDMLAAGTITLDQYKAAQQDQIDITADYARVQTYANQIQAKQAGIVAEGVDVTADYFAQLNKLPPLQQQIALGYADQNEALDIQTTLTQAQAAANGDMSAAQKESLQQTILNRAELDSTYAAMLHQTGVLKGDLDDPESWRIDFSVAAGGQSDLDRLIDSVDYSPRCWPKRSVLRSTQETPTRPTAPSMTC